MPKRSNSFQRLVTFLESQLAPAGATVRESAMLTPSDGTDPREVDIVIESALGPHSVRIGIECRDHKRKATIQWVDELVGRFSHLPVEKRIAVSRAGFTKEAYKAAAHAHIELVTLEDALSADWVQRVAKYKAAVISWNYDLRSARLEYRVPGKPEMTPEQLRDAQICDRDGKVIGSLTDDAMYLFKTFTPTDVQDWLHANADEVFKKAVPQSLDLTFSYNATNRFLVDLAGKRWEISSMSLFVTCVSVVESADMRYFTYQGAPVGTVDVAPAGMAGKLNMTLLFSDAGQPKAFHVQHLRPLAIE